MSLYTSILNECNTNKTGNFKLLSSYSVNKSIFRDKNHIIFEKSWLVYRTSNTTLNFMNGVKHRDGCLPMFLYENMSISMLGGITITDIQSKG